MTENSRAAMRDDPHARFIAESDPRKLYLDLLQRSVLGITYRDERTAGGAGVYERLPFDYAERAGGHDMPYRAIAFGGNEKFANLQACIETCLHEGVEGDLFEAGCWRGGVTVFMRGVLHAYGDTQRSVWCADSFEGEPVPDASYPADAGNEFFLETFLRASLEEAQENFASHGLLDERVKFLKGWFSDTLPTCPVERIAVLRIDGDLYGSNWDAISALYPKVSPGGFVILDDHFVWPAAKAAIDDYRAMHGITEPIERIDASTGFWRRSL